MILFYDIFDLIDTLLLILLEHPDEYDILSGEPAPKLANVPLKPILLLQIVDGQLNEPFPINFDLILLSDLELNRVNISLSMKFNQLNRVPL